MKISQFKDNEAFIENIRLCAAFILKNLKLSSRSSYYLQFQQLNILCRSDIDARFFLTVTKEYRYNKSILTRFAAISYITFVYLCFKFHISIYFFKKVKLLLPLSFPVIIGGNNRLRFVDSSNTFAIVVSKNCDIDFFSKNIHAANDDKIISSLQLMPEIMKCSSFLYFEKQIHGIAINRLKLSSNEENFIDKKINAYFECQQLNAFDVKWHEFLKGKIEIFENFSKYFTSIYYQLFRDICHSIEEWVIVNSLNENVKIVLSHGDLNQGNILYSHNKLNIIDWEFFGLHYVEYDRIVYNYNIRHLSIQNYKKFLKDDNIQDFDKLAFLVEDLLFRCLNFKPDIKDSSGHIDIIKAEIYKRLC